MHPLRFYLFFVHYVHALEKGEGEKFYNFACCDKAGMTGSTSVLHSVNNDDVRTVSGNVQVLSVNRQHCIIANRARLNLKSLRNTLFECRY